MKKLLTIPFILIIGFSYGQADTSNLGFGITSFYIDSLPLTFVSSEIMGLTRSTDYDPYSGKLHSKYDTTILYKGIDTASHDHEFVSEKQKYSGISCGVMHGLEGCDRDWMNKNEICVLCLRHMNIKETRWVEPVKDKYLEAIDRLNKLKIKK